MRKESEIQTRINNLVIESNLTTPTDVETPDKEFINITNNINNNHNIQNTTDQKSNFF